MLNLSKSQIRGNLEKLLQFVVVADANTLTQAAHELRIAQPALSSSMKRLENNLGVQLFERESRRTALTTEGHALKKVCAPLLSQLNQSVFDTLHSDTNTINLAAQEVLLGLLIPPIKFLKLHSPESTVNLKTMKSTSAMLDGLVNLETDVCVVADPEPHPLIDSKEVLKLEYGFYSTNCYWKQLTGLQTSKARTNLSIFDVPVIYPDLVLAPNGKTLGDVLGSINVPSVFNVSTLESVSHLSSRGLGIGILPKQLVAYLAQGHLLTEVKIKNPVSKQLRYLSIKACWRKSNTRAEVRQFLEQL